jgi:hypothetical protein
VQDLGKFSKDEVERYWHEHHRIAYLAEALSVERAEALFGEKRIAEYLERCEVLLKARSGSDGAASSERARSSHPPTNEPAST